MGFLVDLKTPRGHFEINWPLAKTEVTDSFLFHNLEGKVSELISLIYVDDVQKIQWVIEGSLQIQTATYSWEIVENPHESQKTFSYVGHPKGPR